MAEDEADPSEAAELFLRDAGEMGGLIAGFDWSRTSLGPISAWPPSLRTAVGMILRAPTAMALLWGEDGILIYNHGYSIIAGGRHPAILGGRAIDAFAELADFNREVIAACLAGRVLSLPNQRLTLSRNRAPEDVWLDLDYSPVPDESGRPAGVLAVLVETTRRHLADERLRIAQEAGVFGAFEWYPAEKRVVVTDAYRKIWGLGPDEVVTDQRLMDLILPDDHDKTGNHRFGSADNPLAYSEFRIRHASSGEIRWMARRGEIVAGGPGVTERYIGVAWDITDLKRAQAQEFERAQTEQRLRDSEENFRLLAQAMPIQAWISDAQGRNVWVNEQAYAYTGAAPGDLQREDWGRIVHPDDEAGAMAAWSASMRTGETYVVEYRLLRRDGAYRWHIARALPIRDAEGRVVRWIGANTDIDDQRRALASLAQLNATLEDRVEARTRELRATEDALRQAQKMEAIGQLTGGIAHDFNNLLTGIIGSLDLMRMRIAAGRTQDLDRFMDAATTSALSAAALTQRLLAFARRQTLDNRPVCVATLIGGMEDLLRRTLGEQVRLWIAAPRDGWRAMTDPNQLESAILNLAINARDAMPDGGDLGISVRHMSVESASEVATERLEPGDYLAISVADSGVGMSADVLAKAFEPFFTTKPVGQGTGLGLSMVFGFARQSGGDVRIDSAPGAGTRVTLLLPRAPAGTEAAAPPTPTPPAGAGETVLVVEDIAAVRLLIVDVLRELGYRTLEAADAGEALPILESTQAIDLMVSDVGLPGMNGRQLADFARVRRPGLKVLFVTGYAENIATPGARLAEGMGIIAKPFAIEALASKIKQMIG